MSGPPERVFLHIGLHKTGTTYLQSLMRANRANLREQGVEYPGTPDGPAQGLAVWDLQGGRPGDVDDRRIPGSWAALVDLVNASDCRTALLSVEWLSLSKPRQIRRAVESFAESEVHVVVTVRDLARVVGSAWQEEIKNEKTWTWRDYAAGLRDPDLQGVQPARGFWQRQDAAAVCAAWEAEVPLERIHVVTVPHPPTPSSVLVDRFAEVVGFDPGTFTEEPSWTNETIGVAATEVIRRLNLRLDGRLNRRMHAMLVKATLSPMLATRTEPVRFTLPPEELGWVQDRSTRMIDQLASRGYPVVGDLADLQPRPREARRPDDATDEELLEASLDALALLSERFATMWWQRRKTLDEPPDGSVATKTRGLLLQGRRRAAKLAAKRLGR